MLFTHHLTYGKFFSPDDGGGGGTGATSNGDKGNDAGDTTPTTNEPEGGGDGEDETSGLKTALDKEREARKKFEKDFKAAQKRLTEFENANKTDLEKLTGERDELKSKYDDILTRYRETVAESAFMDAAAKANAISPRLLFRAYRSDIQYDDDGQATNLDDVLNKAKADEPTLFKAAAGTGDGGKRGPITDKQDMNTVLRSLANDAPR